MPAAPAGGDWRTSKSARRLTIRSTLISSYRRRGGLDRSPPERGASSDARLLSDDQLATIESTHPAGLTAVQIVGIFTSRGLKLSEASFRKYVQQGLLPRSRRVGRKGKHRGSLGVYPAKTVRRINSVKQLMNQGYTIEEIQAQFLQHTDLVEGIDESVTELLGKLEAELVDNQHEGSTRRTASKELAEARRLAEELMQRLGEMVRRASAPRTERIRRSGAAGSAEDLL